MARAAWAIIVVLAMAGCKDPSNAATSASPKVSSTDVPAAKPRCELVGDYRLRVSNLYHKGWWFRFRVSGMGATTKATVTRPTLALDVTPALAVTLDHAACKLALKGKSQHGGDVDLALEVDAKTGAVKGQLTRTLSDSDDPVAVTGVRDIGPPRPVERCFVPGVYELSLDPQAPWVAGGNVGCAAHLPPPFTVHVEPFLDTIVIDRVERRPPYDQLDADVTVTRNGCDVTYTLWSTTLEVDAKLTFAAGTITGTATKAQYNGNNGSGGEAWLCTAANVTLTAVRKQ